MSTLFENTVYVNLNIRKKCNLNVGGCQTSVGTQPQSLNLRFAVVVTCVWVDPHGQTLVYYSHNG